jgi:hypothetical protein
MSEVLRSQPQPRVAAKSTGTDPDEVERFAALLRSKISYAHMEEDR